ncbi:MAG: putative Coenzyme F420-dependent N(10)-methylenetetrahydromethanopterin reductase [Acidimicrobiales bacterium]|nr:putative Coenzyme F420-dependent N(10)-methylenetetrahydromethanopterin reductase [Acidimicrobiales bacterium]
MRRDQVGTYLLPGRVFDPLDGPRQARDAERLALGAVWLSDRYDQKEVGAMLGAVTQATSRIRVGSAITHPHTRHPLALAGMATTLQALSAGRFTLGLGRSGGGVWAQRGLPDPSTAMLRDVAVLLRRLWAGETMAYEGPLGRFPELRTTHTYDGPMPRLHLAAIGPRTLALAGEVYDGVILHPLLTTEAVARSAALVRGAAERAGRDPSTVQIVATVMVAQGLPEEQAAAVLGGRAVTYLQTPGFGEVLARANGWDPATVDRLRAHPMFHDLRGGLADWTFTLPQLAEAARVLPPPWIEDGTVSGDVATCVERLDAYLDAGADELLLHGNAPSAFESLMAAIAP